MEDSVNSRVKVKWKSIINKFKGPTKHALVKEKNSLQIDRKDKQKRKYEQCKVME